MKVSVFAINNAFVLPILEELSHYHTVEPFIPSGDRAVDLMNIRGLVDWCDIAFADFCHYPLIELTHMSALKCPIVARMHGIEVYQAQYVDWRKVKALIMSTPMKSKFLQQQVNAVPPIHELPVGFNTELFSLTPNKEYGKNLCMQATAISFKKRVYTTVQMFYELRKHDPEWKLHIRGDWTHQWRPELAPEYVEPLKELMEILNLQDDIIVSQNTGPSEWAAWLDDKDIFVSNSIQEGFQKSLAEACGKGLMPAINHWLGADVYYPKEFIVNTQTEMVDKILWWSQLNESEKRKVSREISKHVCDNYDERKIARQIRVIIEEAGAKEVS